jgi:small subunit ribosomal protein S11
MAKPAAAAATGTAPAGRVKRRERKNITSGVAHVNASFNNT